MAAPQPLTSREVFETHFDYVYRVVRYLGAPPSDVEDVAQEVFLVVHRNLGSLKDPNAISGWLFGIARRVISDYRKKAFRRREVPSESVSAERDAVASPERDAEARQALSQLQAILVRLPEEQRLVFLLYEVEGLGMKEITELVGCPLQTGYTRLRAARSVVQQSIPTVGKETA